MTEDHPPYDGTPYVEPRTDTFITRSITIELTDRDLTVMQAEQYYRTLAAIQHVADRIERTEDGTTRIMLSAEGIKRSLLQDAKVQP